MELHFNLNGVDVTWNISPSDYLAPILRENGILSVKIACDESACGACSVLLDDKPVLSCSLLAVRVEGHKVTTVEGIQDEAAKISEYFSSEGADQCGFCNAGFAILIHGLRREYKNPSDEQIKKYIVGNLCRCTGYQSQFKAIKHYLEDTK